MRKNVWLSQYLERIKYGQPEEAAATVLEEQGIKFVPTSFTREITKKAIQIQDDVKKVWPGIKCGDYYTVIREFNMTKANVFPEEMLNDPQKSICMFVKKRELPMASGS